MQPASSSAAGFVAVAPRRRSALNFFVVAVLLLAGCRHSEQATNQPLSQAEIETPALSGEYRLGSMMNMMMQPFHGEVLAVMAFSGGGKRSAAFAHGALRGASKFIIDEDKGPRRLIDEVDMIVGVSGGSFPAAHYGLYRDQSFQTFPEAFLYRDINSYIWGTYLLPWNWGWVFDPLYGTNDRMARVYDELMFHGATYADLQKKGPPFIAINATDIAGGVPFSFTQSYFDTICSDLSSFPVAQAVAASNGFPVLFSPITLKSYRPACDAPRPMDMLVGMMRAPESLSRRSVLERQIDRYMDPERTSYVHLMDGGISDNLALRTLVNAVLVLDRTSAGFTHLAVRTRRVVVLSVDGEAATDPSLGRQRVVTGVGQVVSAVSGGQIDAYNFETLTLAQQQTAQLVADLRKARCTEAGVIDGHPCDDVTGGLIYLSLDQIADPAERARLQAIPTGLTIPKQEVDMLVEYGERLVLENTELHTLVDGLARPAN
jgi:NTE family protein